MTRKPKMDGKAKAKNSKKDLSLTTEDATQVKGGASDIFAKIGDIKGESLDAKRTFRSWK